MKTVKIENINQTFRMEDINKLNVKTFGTEAIANEFIKEHSLIANIVTLSDYFEGSIVLDMGNNEFFVIF